MRIWHVELIDVLPQRQLLSQWRELLYFKKSVILKGSLKHVLVDVVLKSPLSDFKIYADIVAAEMLLRNFNLDLEKYRDIMLWDGNNSFVTGDIEDMHSFDKPGNFSISYAIFTDWHNSAYLRQCLANLKEKYDRKSISAAEWKKVDEKFHNIIQEMKI